MNLSLVFSPGGIRMNDSSIAECDRDLIACGCRDDYLACVCFEFRNDSHHAQRSDGGISDRWRSGWFVLSERSALASNASVHSTRMLRNFSCLFLWLYSQLISAQNQWIRRSMR